jgi:GTP-binding protein HflX
MPKVPLPTESPRERAYLVGVGIDGQDALLSPEDSLTELARLAETAGLQIVGAGVQRVRRPNPKTLLSAAKVAATLNLADESLADVVVFDDELSPRHQRELERAFGEDVRVLDRTALILDIFAQHAHSREGALQVELAQYEYRLPRLTRAWTHLARQAGGGAGRTGGVGGVGLRGPGETQLEIDRRDIGRRIAHLRRELDRLRAHRGRYRSRRRRAAVPTVALVGYTNAGKSTLLNRLAGSDALVADQLFATLDPMTRRLDLPDGRSALVTDTVGFIQKLPTMLIAAFRATLEEISEADLLVHVVDASHPAAEAQARAVEATLQEIGAGEVPVVTALNKIDVMPARARLVDFVDEFDRAIPISGLTGEGLPLLLRAVEDELDRALVRVDARIAYAQGGLLSRMYQAGVVEQVDHEEQAIHIRARLPKDMAQEVGRIALKPRRRRRTAEITSNPAGR